MRPGPPATLRIDPRAAEEPPPNPGKPAQFHLTARLGRLCRDICARVPEFQHIDMARVLVTYAQCRNRRRWGVQAKLTPLRFAGGAAEQVRRGVRYRIQELHLGLVQQLYVLTFYLPRFLDQTFDEKLVTVFHELYHIGPRFDGDIRRFPGAKHIHTGSQKQYDRAMAEFARAYLAMPQQPELFDFLRCNLLELQQRHGAVVGLKIPVPKLLPLRAPPA